jgi:hypothetical protein
VLNRIHDALWTVAAPQRFLGLHLGTRMTVVALHGGGLLLHSPVPLTDPLRAEIDAIGPVRHVVCSNYYHHLHAGPWSLAYPDAALHGPAELADKRPDLRGLRALSEEPHPDWKGDLVPLFIAGSMLRETVFVHPASRSLVSSDLVENFETSDHLPTRFYLKLGGVHGKLGWSRLLRFVYRDRAAARASLDRLLSHDFDRVVLAHGHVVEHDGKERLRKALSWL